MEKPSFEDIQAVGESAANFRLSMPDEPSSGWKATPFDFSVLDGMEGMIAIGVDLPAGSDNAVEQLWFYETNGEQYLIAERRKVKALGVNP